MIALTRLSPQVCASVSRRTQHNIGKFSDLGIDSRLDVISLENVEYVSKLLAIETAIPDHVRSPHDREIVLRVCDQFCASDIPELREWAIAELKKQQTQIQLEIQNCETALTELLQRLESLETRQPELVHK